MFRIAIIALIVYLVWTLLKWITGSPRSAKVTSGNAAAPAEMVACKQCGTFIMKTEALSHRGSEFCSQKCINGRNS